MFKPIEKESALYPTKYYEKIIAEISDMVSNGELKVGEILPSERELAEYFETSRVPVREALKILEFLGLVRHVPGKGMQICEIEISSLISKVFFGMNISEETPQQLFDIRCLVEPYAAAQAALKATPEDIQRIQQVLYDENDLPIKKQSIDFHLAVVSASHNQLLVEIYNFLASVLATFRAKSLDERYENGPIQFHIQIFNAIKNHDDVVARHLMSAHLEEERAHLKQ